MKNIKVAIAGGVNSSRKTLEKLIEHNCDIRLVLALDPNKAMRVSGYQDIGILAKDQNLPYTYFNNINDSNIIDRLIEQDIDYLFVVGLSQIIKPAVISTAKKACIGYHPTKLPTGRGRAAIAWIILGEAEPAVTLFKIDEGVDSGDIYKQIPMYLTGTEYPNDIIMKLMIALGKALDELIPELKNDSAKPIPQNEDDATYLEIRKPEDGYINWEKSAAEISLLIRAVSEPLPGAFTYHDQRRLMIWRAFEESSFNVKGVTGRVIKTDDTRFWVQCGSGVLCVEKYSIDTNATSLESVVIKKGDKLGLDLLQFIHQK